MELKAVAGNPVLNATGVQSPNNFTTSIANSNAQLLQNYRLALAKVRNGTSNANILCIGDSTFEGTGSDGSPPHSTTSFPARLAQMLNNTINPAVNGLAIANESGSSVDTRWTMGSGWNNNAGFGPGVNACYQASPGAGNLVFTPGVNCDGFYIIYIGTTTTTTLTATATGGSPVTVTETAVSNGTYKSVLISAGSASSSNTLAMTPASGGTSYIVAVLPVLSTKKQILIGNAGVGGSRSSDWNSNAPFGGVDFIKAFAPDLTIISLGINDVYNTVATSVSMGNIQALITAAQISGDVMLASMPPGQTDPGKSAEAAFVAALEALAVSSNCLFLDFYNRLKGTWTSSYMNDFTHPNDWGYWDWAASAASLLSGI